jgi:hypothetical protein
LTQVKHTAPTKPEANRQERPFAAMRSPIQLKHAIAHAIALIKRALVTVHEKYANDMEYVASILVRLLTRVGRGRGIRGVLQDAQLMTHESSRRAEPRFLYV